MTFDPPDWFTRNAPPDAVCVVWGDSTSDAPSIVQSAPSFALEGVVFDGEALLDDPPELVQGMLPTEGIAFLGGQSGAGKTFIAVDLAVCLATQQPFFGRKVRTRVGVAYVAVEGASTLGTRFEAARRHRAAGPQLPIARVKLAGDLTNPHQMEA